MQCPECGSDMWDNRESKRSPKAPDYKCKDKSCPGVVWPPRQGGKAQAAPKAQYVPRDLGPYVPILDDGDPGPWAAEPAQGIAPAPVGRATPIVPENKIADADIDLMIDALKGAIYSLKSATPLAAEHLGVTFDGAQICSVAATLYIQSKKR